jgi:CrcB protein
MLRIALIVGLGGFLGTLARYFSMQWVSRSFQLTFPLGTLLVNILGCFLIGVFWSLSDKNQWFSSDLRLFLSVGFCGGFTTFSTFTADSLMLIRNAQFLHLTGYVLISVVVGIIFTYLGYALVKLM